MALRSRYIIAVDQGTTNTKAVVVDRQSRIMHRASRAVHITFPKAGWVEQDATEIWATTREALQDCFTMCRPQDVAAIGITNQRESIVVWQRRDGTPVAPCISWQCLRSAEICKSLKNRGLNASILSKTGLRVDPMFSASKLAWLLESDRELRARAEAGDLCAGTVDSWLTWKLTDGLTHACDASNASRTQLFNLQKFEWDEELLSMFRIPRCMLPVVYSSNAYFGESGRTDGIEPGIPILAVLGDSHAALFAHAAFRPGMVKATYGTGSSLMTPAFRVSSDERIATTIAWALHGNPQFALEGNITATGAAVQWVGEFLGLNDPVQDTGRLARSVPDSGGVSFVPALAGMGAPHWNEQARGMISGLTRGSSSAHLARATIDAIAFQVRDVLETMEQAAGTQLPTLLADGGASENEHLMQVQADAIGRPVLRSCSRDLSAQGAAWMAGLGSGFWRALDDLEAIPQEVVRYEPQLSAPDRESRYQQWSEAVARALNTPSASERVLHE